jgi:hypothetical protein
VELCRQSSTVARMVATRHPHLHKALHVALMPGVCHCHCQCQWYPRGVHGDAPAPRCSESKLETFDKHSWQYVQLSHTER